MSIEINKKKCKVCGLEKDRILIGHFNHKDKKYVDENGKSWNGYNCPQCHKESIRRRMQAMRVLKKSIT